MNYVLAIVIFSLIVIVESWTGVKLSFSSWQLHQKRDNRESKTDRLDLDRLKYRAASLSWQVFILVLLYIGLFLSLKRFDKLKSVDVWLIVVAVFGVTNMLAKLKICQSLTNKIFVRIELKLYKIFKPLNKVNRLLNVLSFMNTSYSPQQNHLESIKQLNFLLDNSPAIISDSQRLMISSGLEFFDKKVQTVTVKLDEIFAVEPNELLTPIRIDELHKTGHSHFPVFTKNDELVGILDLRRLSSLEIKDTLKVKELMCKEFLSFSPTDSIEYALFEMLQAKEFLAIVKSKQKILGIVSLKDLIRQLLGR